MEIADQRVVSMHYTLTNAQGDVIDSSQGNEPLVYLHGGGNIIPGLEKALLGKNTGDKLAVKVEPPEGSGERNDPPIQQVPPRAFQGIKAINTGMRTKQRGE